MICAAALVIFFALATMPLAQSTRNPLEADLLAATQQRNPQDVERLIAQGVDVNSPRPDGSTPLLWAALRDAPMTPTTATVAAGRPLPWPPT